MKHIPIHTTAGTPLTTTHYPSDMKISPWIAGLAISWAGLVDALYKGSDVSFGVLVAARKVECFYVDLDTVHNEVSFDFVVMNGGQGDINAYIRDPSGNVIERKNMVADGSFVIKPIPKATEEDKDWAYAFCLDNSFSRMSNKRVDVDVWGDGDIEAYEPVVSDLEEQVADLTDVAADVRRAFRNVFRIQAYLRHRGIRHEYTAQSIHSRVVAWSVIFLVLLVAVPIAQVVFVRRLLANSGRPQGGRGPNSAYMNKRSAGISF